MGMLGGETGNGRDTKDWGSGTEEETEEGKKDDDLIG